MGGKRVTDISGIGPHWGEVLRWKGFEFATQILGQYLVFNRDEQKFRGWLQQQFGIWWLHSAQVYNALQEWSIHHVF